MAYADPPQQHRTGIALDTFSSIVGNAYLQRHLMAVQPTTLEAVCAGNELLQVPTTRLSVKVVEDVPEGEAQVTRVDTGMQAVLEALSRSTAEIKQLQHPANSRLRTDQSKDGKPKHNRCFACNKGHFKRNCSTLDKNEETPESGNFHGRQQ